MTRLSDEGDRFLSERMAVADVGADDARKRLRHSLQQLALQFIVTHTQAAALTYIYY